MSLTTLDQSTRDQALVNRLIAAVSQEAWANDELGDTDYGLAVKANAAVGIALIWPTAIDYREEYAFAVGNGNPNPGGDPGVISDGNIASSVQAHWPATWPMVPAP